jgi:putative OPT family oligopeptide transporter
MTDHKDGPYVPANTSMAELTFKALFLGVLMAIVLGAANAYIGMKAGLTVAATFPAAVVAIAVLRPFRGTVLEENIARTTASVGEALVAGAIFTLPAFIIAGVWDDLHYWESTFIMLIGGLLGVLFIVVLRRTLVVEADLPFPESVAAAEIVKAGQKGDTGAKYVFIAMILAGIWELFKNSNGIQYVRERSEAVVEFSRSTVDVLGSKIEYAGGLLVASPSASPALMGVGFIVGLRVSAVLFAGAVMGWLVLVPLAVFLNPAIGVSVGAGVPFPDLATEVWSKQIRPLAVGTMIVAAFYTLYSLKDALVTGIRKAMGDIGSAVGKEAAERTEIDLPFMRILPAIGVMAVATFFLYYFFTGSVGGAFGLTIVMVILGFLFAAVAGYLVGLIGSSNNPISGLTLSALVIAAVLMVAMGVTGVQGIIGVLGVAGVVCVTAGVAGDMMQDLKVGHILGGTPWRMQIGEIVGVIAAAFVLAFAIMALDKAYVIGSAELPAPQAGLMALIAQGIVGGQMAWPLVIVGMLLAVALILIKAPSPMLIAVGMYLPFYSTGAIFVGGLIRGALDKWLQRARASEEERTRATNVGVLLSSGFIAGESLMAVLLAFLLLGGDFVPTLLRLRESLSPEAAPSFLLSLVAFPALVYGLVWFPIRRMRADRTEAP